MKSRLFVYALVFCVLFGLDKIAWTLVLVWGATLVEASIVAVLVTRDHRRTRSGRAHLAVAMALALVSIGRAVDARPDHVAIREGESQTAFLARAHQELFR